MAKQPKSYLKTGKRELIPLDAHLAKLLNPALPQAKQTTDSYGFGEAPQAGFDAGSVEALNPELAKSLGLEAKNTRRWGGAKGSFTREEMLNSKPTKVAQGNVVKDASEDDDLKSSAGVKATQDALDALLLAGDPSFRGKVTWEPDRKSTRLNSSHPSISRMPSSA